MESIDYQFKDARPVDTVNRIRDILSQYEISVTETPGNSGVKNCYSSRVTIDGTGLGTNGKGITPEFCSASGHAELMERLQSGCMSLRIEPRSYQDLIEVDREGLIEHCGKWLDEIGAVASTSDGEDLTKDDIIDGIFQISSSGKALLIPFYDVSTKTRTYFPYALLMPLYSSNGLAAGNTMEEALVQGFSEIVERHNREKFLSGDLVPPNIPEDYLRQFPTAYETICEIRKNGYDVYIKDCSLGEPFPLVATVLIDRKTHGYHVHMGANPVFEIALERSLTEMFQGRSIAKIADVSSLYMGKKGQRRSAEDIRRVHVYGMISYPMSFFSGTPSYEFKPFPDCSKKDNKTLLREILAFLEERGKTLLIRDYSHFGFPTFRLIVPGMSESYFDNFTRQFPLLRFMQDSAKVFCDVRSATADELFSASMLAKYQYALTKRQRFTFSGLSKLPIKLDPAYDALLGMSHFAYIEWALGNRMQALKYVSGCADSIECEESAYLDCLCKAFVFVNQGASYGSALSGLCLFYEDDVIREVREVFETGKNPFERLVFRCDAAQCDACKFSENCLQRQRKNLQNTLQNAISVFDNDAAFERIGSLFKNL